MTGFEWIWENITVRCGLRLLGIFWYFGLLSSCTNETDDSCNQQQDDDGYSYRRRNHCDVDA